ncbi:MAG: hypothetical protein JWL96_3682 [Sphingomonas bacterium]|uniref:hypothetical protein n=1 Tax=Sphingomonas bacterium TaxID=1895847 RepID=UPI002618E582|nr:hypothetical protein [Sphingomonas bacterium]MDB5711612.1 hypothetical protein [Sphingomonas bacterium]
MAVLAGLAVGFDRDLLAALGNDRGEVGSGRLREACPGFGPADGEPVERGADVRRDVHVVRDGDRPAALGCDDFLGGVVIADGTLVEGTLDAVVPGILADPDGCGRLVVQQAPAVEGTHRNAEGIGDLDIGRAIAAPPLGDAGEFRFVRRGASCGHEDGG